MKVDLKSPSFQGFPAAGLQFLRDLKENNDRDWFRERKDVYDEQVKAPMELLIAELAPECRRRGVPLFAKEKSPVMRIHRDIRFSPDKRPFNSRVGASLRRTQQKDSLGEMYIHISPEESFLAAGFWMPDRPFLHLWRESMAKDPRKFEKVLNLLSKNGLALTTDGKLKRLPRGYEAQAEGKLAEAFRLTSYVVVQNLKPATYHSRKLLDESAGFAAAAKPLLEYGWNLNYSPRRDILDDSR